MKGAEDAAKNPDPIRDRSKELRLGRRLLWGGGAFLTGVCLSAAFPPLEWAGLSWLMLVPLLFIVLRPHCRAGWLGYAFGFGHFLTCFGWLRTVFVLAPVGLGLMCAVYPALWCWLGASLYANLLQGEAEDLLPDTDPARTPPEELTPLRQCVFLLLMSLAWVGLEWIRSWIFSGLPWNQLGASQWRNPLVLPVLSFTGVYGISFLIVATNITVFFLCRRWLQRRAGKPTGRVPWPAVVLVTVFGIAMLSHGRYKPGGQRHQIRVAAAQGNIPQIRQFTPEQLEFALNVYLDLSRQIVPATQPDLLIWPETAVPADILADPRCAPERERLQAELKTPLLVGSVRFTSGPDEETLDLDDYQGFNSILFFNAGGELKETYDKMHLVPFGEYVPFDEHLPWLVEWIGMGRNLTAGQEFTILPFGAHAKMGFNICYEDAFPEISRGAVLHGANVLVTVTNDAWYMETAGSRQHLAHSVLRSVETCRPMMRCGNNSDTCLIMPNGDIVNILYDPDTGNRFVRRAGLFTVPIWEQLPVTFYTRYGNVFAVLGFLVLLSAAGYCGYRHMQRKRRLHEAVMPSADDT